MALTEVMHKDVAVIELKGELMDGSETDELRAKVKELASKGIIKVVADLSKVTWMNGTGLGALMGGMTSLHNAKGALKLARVTDHVGSSFVINKLMTIFDCFDTVDDAVAAFRN